LSSDTSGRCVHRFNAVLKSEPLVQSSWIAPCCKQRHWMTVLGQPATAPHGRGPMLSSLPADSPPLTWQNAEHVLKLCSEAEPAKLIVSSHVTKDLGWDSVDPMEIIRAEEDEFGLDVPDAKVEKSTYPQETVGYAADKKVVYEKR
uniref:Acyl carrier protein, mitochondrial n=1 Tax=Dromaius novaehollandiae TaxID=8790 RepID=A0A8C4PB75_DRONO